VAYDIRDPKRLRDVHTTAKRYGYALQYSVFICDLADQDLIRLKWDMGDVIHDDHDEVVIVDLGDVRDTARFEFLGRRPILPRQGPTIV
jgi:CRISPR-associated protein Cas2